MKMRHTFLVMEAESLKSHTKYFLAVSHYLDQFSLKWDATSLVAKSCHFRSRHLRVVTWEFMEIARESY